MRSVGVRDLKEHASEILRRVREEGDSFEVTYHGRVVARLVPISAPEAESSAESFWAEWDNLSADASGQWRGKESALDAVREQRRNL